MASEPRIRVLVAVLPETKAMLEACLPEMALMFVHTLQAARRMFNSHRFDAVVVATRFDDSRIFELLDQACDCQAVKDVPVVVVQVLPSRLPPALLHAVEPAMAELGVYGFVTIHGHDVGALASKVRAAVEEAAPGLVPAAPQRRDHGQRT
jgi:hypothetical protein